MLRLPRNLHFEAHHVLCLPRNLHVKVHQVLRLYLEVRQVLHLPRNLHFEVHKVLRLPRNLHFEAHLPRTLHFEVQQVLAPATVCTSRFTKCCACHEICSARFTKCCTCHKICTSTVTECCACHEICTNEPHVQKSRFTAPVTKSELLKDHHHVQSAVPATKIAFRSKTAPVPCTCHEKSLLEHQNTRFPLRLPRKVITMCENATTRAQLLEAPTAATQILRACAVEMHIGRCNELAGDARDAQRSKHTFLKNPSVCPHCLGKKCRYIYIYILLTIYTSI